MIEFFFITATAAILILSVYVYKLAHDQSHTALCVPCQEIRASKTSFGRFVKTLRLVRLTLNSIGIFFILQITSLWIVQTSTGEMPWPPSTDDELFSLFGAYIVTYVVFIVYVAPVILLCNIGGFILNQSCHNRAIEAVTTVDDSVKSSRS